MAEKIRKLVLILVCVGVIVFFNARIDDYFRGQVTKVANQVKYGLKGEELPQKEFDGIQSDIYRMMHDASVKADVYGNFLIILLLVMAPFLLLEKKSKDE